MTTAEKKFADALSNCSFLPGSADKRFVRQLPNWHDRGMTVKGRAHMLKLAVKYKRQIPNLSELFGQLKIEETTKV